MASSLAMNGFRKKTHIWLGNRGRRGRIVLNTFTLVLSCSPPFTTQYLFGGDLRRNKVYYTTTSSQRLATSFLEDFTALGDLCPRKHHGKMRKMPNFRGCKLIKGNIKAQVLCYTRPTSKYMVKLLSAAALKWVIFPRQFLSTLIGYELIFGVLEITLVKQTKLKYKVKLKEGACRLGVSPACWPE